MAHKVHPKSYRIRRIDDWDSRGYYKNTAIEVEEDFRVREFLTEKLKNANVEKIEIERFPSKLVVIIFSARPGLIIGRRGEGVEMLRKELIKKVLKRILLDREDEKDIPLEKKSKGKNSSGKEKKGKEVEIEIKEIRDPWTSASLAAQWIAQRIEKRLYFRVVMKQALNKIESHKEILGTRIELAGRLGGNEFSRREWLQKGSLPRQTIRADIDYAEARARCSYGTIGVKVWMYKGEKFK